jgi:colanic acid/amylovoran biosynthesis glycosyltransferase
MEITGPRDPRPFRSDVAKSSMIPMKLVFVAYDKPEYAAGPIVNMRRLLPALHARGHDVTALVLYHGGKAPNAERLIENGVKCRLLSYSPARTERHIRWISEQVADLQPDVFVPNISIPGFFASRWVRSAGIPTIATYRNDDLHHDAVVKQFVFGPKNWAVSALVCVSSDLSVRVAARNPLHTQLAVIPSGVPVPGKIKDHAERLRVILVGRLVEDGKQISAAIEALCGVARELPDVTITIVGTGPEEERVKSMVSHAGLTDRITFLGFIDCFAIQTELLKHNVLVLLSDYEGTPGALMDGMACGLVPVCLDIPGGVRELVTNGVSGLLITNRSDALIDAISRLSKDPELRRTLSKGARRRITERFSLDYAVSEWENLCVQLVEKRRPRRPIRIPRKLKLPPVLPELSHEDRRESRPSFRNSLRGLLSGNDTV